MVYKIDVVNKNNGDNFSFELEKKDGKLVYFDANLNEYVHPQEVADNMIREVNNNVILVNSPIHYLKQGESGKLDTSITFDITITYE